MKILVCTLALAACTIACAPAHKDSPEELREKTADATATLKQDTKAVAEGIREGLSGSRSGDKTLDLNHAGKDDLMALPGVTSERADRIIAARPYTTAHELVTRKIVSPEEYDRIKDRISIKN